MNTERLSREQRDLMECIGLEAYGKLLTTKFQNAKQLRKSLCTAIFSRIFLLSVETEQ